MDEMVVLNTEEQLEAYRLLSLIKGLDIEIRTGIKMRNGMSLTKIAKQYGVHERLKANCREALADIYEDMTGRKV